MTRNLPLSYRHKFIIVTIGIVAVTTFLYVMLFGGPLTDKGTQPPLTNALKPPSNCGCHQNYDSVNNLEPWDNWAGMMMAQSGRDPLFWATLDVANNDVADAGDFCIRCHSPVGWLGGRSEPPGGSTDGCGLLGIIDGTGADFDGLTCHFCHRYMINSTPPPGEDPVYYENGQFWIDDVDCPGGNEPCRRGPYNYPLDGQFEPNHEWLWSDYHENSDICGNCHNVTNPLLNLIEDGTDTGVKYPIERTFKEWQQSAYSIPGPDYKTCQNCHMPDATVDPAHACQQGKNNHTGDLPMHRFIGGNAWIPDVLRQEYTNLGRDAEFIMTRDNTIAFLQNQTATVAITVPAQVPAGQDLLVQATITNLTGHKLPTGYPEGRRMWINVQARDGLNNLIWESGAYDIASGVLTNDAQIKVYHSEPGIWDYNGTSHCDITDGNGDPMFHFVLNNCVETDNRIPPLGFTGGTDVEIKPVNYVYPETSPGSGVLVNYDTTDYAIPIPVGTESPVTVTAILKYQTTSKEYIEFLLSEAIQYNFPDDCIPRSWGTPTLSRAEILYNNWNTYGKAAPVDVDSDAGTSVVLPPTSSPPGAVPDNDNYAGTPLTISKSGTTDLQLNWSAPGGTCETADYGVYRGALPFAGYTHSSVLCSTSNTTQAIIAADTGSYYYLIVAQNNSKEGSYGVDSLDAQRPVAAVPCVTQEIGTCN